MRVKIVRDVGLPGTKIGDVVDASDWPNAKLLLGTGHITPVPEDEAAAADSTANAPLVARVSELETQVIDLLGRLDQAEEKLATLGDEAAQEAVSRRKGRGANG